MATCKQCGKEMGGVNKFCSPVCRNLWVSEYMIKRAKAAKKEFGNAYYSRKEGEEHGKDKE